MCAENCCVVFILLPPPYVRELARHVATISGIKVMAMVLHGAGGISVSVSCPMLTAENYTIWTIKVEAILDAHGMWEAVVSEKGVAVDDKKNKTAWAQLLDALSEDILL